MPRHTPIPPVALENRIPQPACKLPCISSPPRARPCAGSRLLRVLWVSSRTAPRSGSFARGRYERSSMCARRNRGMAPNGMRPSCANSRRCVRCCVRARDGGEGDASGRARGLMDARVRLQGKPRSSKSRGLVRAPAHQPTSRFCVLGIGKGAVCRRQPEGKKTTFLKAKHCPPEGPPSSRAPIRSD